MTKPLSRAAEIEGRYQTVFTEVAEIIRAARRSAARSVNAAMTAAYWLVGRHVVEFEQGGEERAGYGIELIERLSDDLSRRFGRGFSRQNLQQMRLFYMTYQPERIRQTPSGETPATLPLISIRGGSRGARSGRSSTIGWT